MNVWQAKTGCNRRNGFKMLLAFAIDLRCKSLRVLALRCQSLLCAANHCFALQVVALRCESLLCAASCCSALPIVALRCESLRCRSCRRVRLSAQARFSLHNSCCCQVGAQCPQTKPGKWTGSKAPKARTLAKSASRCPVSSMICKRSSRKASAGSQTPRWKLSFACRRGG